MVPIILYCFALGVPERDQNRFALVSSWAGPLPVWMPFFCRTAGRSAFIADFLIVSEEDAHSDANRRALAELKCGEHVQLKVLAPGSLARTFRSALARARLEPRQGGGAAPSAAHPHAVQVAYRDGRPEALVRPRARRAPARVLALELI
jgi:hypothetical protein